MTIGDLAAHFRTKDRLQKMVDRFGKKETATRLAWLHDCSEEKAAGLVDQYLADDYVDDRGVRGGKFFWGDY